VPCLLSSQDLHTNYVNECA